MSILKVDTIQEKTSGNGVLIPGHVAQVVNDHTYTQVAATSATFIDTGVQATITPLSTSSLILISAFTQMGTGAANTWGGFRFTRNGTSLDYLTDFTGWTNTTDYAVGNVSFQQIDTPSTTSSVTYKLQFNNEQATSNVFAQFDSGSANQRSRGQIILMEIAQ